MVDFKSVYFGKYNKAKGLNEGMEMSPKIRPDENVMDANQLMVYYVVPKWQEMRIDLVMTSIYGNDPAAMSAIDVILVLNNIDNPMNIKANQVLKCPKSLDAIDDFRYDPVEIKGEAENPLELLAKANKNTKVDPKRKAFIENGYAVPPTVNKTPISPIRVETGNFLAGGVK